MWKVNDITKLPTNSTVKSKLNYTINNIIVFEENKFYKIKTYTKSFKQPFEVVLIQSEKNPTTENVTTFYSFVIEELNQFFYSPSEIRQEKLLKLSKL